MKIFIFARKKNTLIFFSSRKVYKSKENIKESSKLNHLSNYSKNKLITENFLKNKFKSNLLILRISNIIGFKKKQKNLHSTFVDMFYEKAKKGFELTQIIEASAPLKIPIDDTVDPLLDDSS